MGLFRATRNIFTLSFLVRLPDGQKERIWFLSNSIYPENKNLKFNVLQLSWFPCDWAHLGHDVTQRKPQPFRKQFRPEVIQRYSKTCFVWCSLVPIGNTSLWGRITKHALCSQKSCNTLCVCACACMLACGRVCVCVWLYYWPGGKPCGGHMLLWLTESDIAFLGLHIS